MIPTAPVGKPRILGLPQVAQTLLSVRFSDPSPTRTIAPPAFRYAENLGIFAGAPRAAVARGVFDPAYVAVVL